MGQGVFVNGVYKSWASCETTLGGTTLVDIQSIDYDDEQQGEEVQGAGNGPHGIAYSGYQANCKLTVLREEWENVILPKLGQVLYRHDPFDITVSYADAGGANPKTDQVKGCRLKKVPHKAGVDTKGALTIDLEFWVLGGIWRQGVKPIPVGS